MNEPFRPPPFTHNATPGDCPPKWRRNHRPGDHEISRLTKKSKPGDRVYFDPGPGLRVSGILKDWSAEGMADIEVDSDDQRHVQSKKTMKVPVTR